MERENKITIDTFKTVTKAIAQSDNLDIMTNHLSQLLVAALGIKACAIFLLDLETRELEIFASFGLTPAYLSKGPVLADESIAANVEGEPIIIPDVANDDRIQYPDEAKKEGIAAMLSIPIVVAGGVLGVLRLYHHRVWDITEEDLDSLGLLTDFIGLAMTYTSLRNAIDSINEIIQLQVPVSVSPTPRKRR